MQKTLTLSYKIIRKKKSQIEMRHTLEDEDKEVKKSVKQTP